MMLALLLVAGLGATSISATFPDVHEYPRLECPEGWTLLDRTCFLLADEAGTWDAGQSFCNQWGATLVSGLKPNKFLCSKPPELITTPPTTVTTATLAPVCEEGWEMFEDAMCYKVSDEKATWPRAREACLAQYAQLAAVTSEGQQNFLAARISGDIWGRVRDIWIGLNDREEEGTFKWQDGTEPGYTNWYEGEPNSRSTFKNGFVGEHCVKLTLLYGYMWNDYDCDWKEVYMCQKPPSKTHVLPSHT